MKLNILFIEIGIKNIKWFRKHFKPENANIFFASSFLDVIDLIFNNKIDIIVLSDFKGIDHTVGYIKMFITTNPELKVILLSSHREITNDHIYFYIQRGADTVVSDSFIDDLVNRIDFHYSKIVFKEKINPKWSSCTKSAILFLFDNYNIIDDFYDQLSLRTGYSLSSIYHSVKNDTAVSFGEWHRKIKIDNAVLLMKNKTLQLKEISRKVGYSTYLGFAKTFKQLTGLSPQDYRKNNL